MSVSPILKTLALKYAAASVLQMSTKATIQFIHWVKGNLHPCTFRYGFYQVCFGGKLVRASFSNNTLFSNLDPRGKGGLGDPMKN